MSQHTQITVGQWITDNWLGGFSAADMEPEMAKAGYGEMAIAAMHDFVYDLDIGMAAYSNMEYGLHLIEVHSMNGGRF